MTVEKRKMVASISEPKGSPADKAMTEVPLDVSGTPQIMQDNDLLSSILSAPDDVLTPYQMCKLPSLGLYYDWNGIDSCEVRPMNRQVELMMTKQDAASDGSAVDRMLQYCCRFPDNMDPLNLLIGDRTYLMFYIRGITHGNNYKFTAQCPHCNQSGLYDFPINTLQSSVVYADKSIKEPYKLVLPKMSEITGKEVWVSMRFLRGSDLYKSLHDYKVKKSMLTGGSSGGRVRASKVNSRNVGDPNEMRNQMIDDMTVDCIHDVLGNTDRQIVREFMNKVQSADLEVIREWIDKYMPSIDTSVTISCLHCDKEFSIELPLSDYFFRPKKT